LLGAGDKLGLVITPGPHKDTQELQLPVMRWFNKHLKGEETPVENAAVKMFTPQQLKVFDKLPGDAVNTNIHLTFVKTAEPAVPKTKAEWEKQRDAWLSALREKSFAAWPTGLPSAELVQGFSVSSAWTRGTFAVRSQPGVNVMLDYELPNYRRVASFVIRLKSSGDAADAIQRRTNAIVAHAIVRGLGTNGMSRDAKKQTQIRRRYMLLGETVDSARVWDIVRAIEGIRGSKEFGKLPLRLEAEGDMAVNALYASLFAPADELVLTNLPQSHMSGPDYLNVLRILDVPQAVAMASERCRVELRGAKEADWSYALQAARDFGWEKNLRLVSETAVR
jgi:hypothetical protein